MIQYFQTLIPQYPKNGPIHFDNMILIHDGYQSLSTMKDASRLCVRVSFFLSILIFCIRFSLVNSKEEVEFEKKLVFGRNCEIEADILFRIETFYRCVIYIFKHE